LFSAISFLFLFFLGITIVHELAHILTARIFGIRMTLIKFHCTNFDPSRFSKIARWKKAFVIVAGPAMTFIISCFLFAFGVSDYALIAFILFLLNVIPFQGSDVRNLSYYLRR